MYIVYICLILILPVYLHTMDTVMNNLFSPQFNSINCLTHTVDLELDVKGLNCPLPILHTKKMLANMLTGQILRIITTDSGAIRDIQIFTKQTGHNLLGQYPVEGYCVHIVQRK